MAEHGLPPGYRFVPTDEELVELCLLPRIQGQRLLPNDIIADDPLSAPPWALLEKHGRRHQAFFFASCRVMNAKGGRQKRTCEGHGTWQGQGKRKRKEDDDQGPDQVKKKLRLRGGAGKMMEIGWDKYALNFHERGFHGSSGWVMHEYAITAPPELARSPARLYCVRFSGHGRNAKKNSRDARHRGDDDEFEDEEEVEDEAAGAIGGSGAVEEEPAALFFHEYPPPAPQLEFGTCVPVMAADVVSNTNPAADGAGAGAGYDDQDLDLPGLVDYDDGSIFRNAKKLRRDAQEDEVEEVDDAAGAITSNTTWSAEEEDAALLIEEYLTSFPLVEVDDSANPADGQDLPALVDDSFDIMSYLDFSQ